MKLHRRELHTVLAALRHWQRGHLWTDREVAIATDWGQHPMLGPHEIEALYEKLAAEA